jgi:hypothetical protein
MTDANTEPAKAPALLGWKCPECLRVHAPFVSTCPYCAAMPYWPYQPVQPVQPYQPWPPYNPTYPFWTYCNTRTG